MSIVKLLDQDGKYLVVGCIILTFIVNLKYNILGVNPITGQRNLWSALMK